MHNNSIDFLKFNFKGLKTKNICKVNVDKSILAFKKYYFSFLLRKILTQSDSSLDVILTGGLRQIKSNRFKSHPGEIFF